MSKASLGIQPTRDGATLLVIPEGEPAAAIPLPLERLKAVFADFWRVLGLHYPNGDSSPDATPPRAFEFSDYRVDVHGRSDGTVHLWLRPSEFAGISFELTPDNARDVAKQLIEAADTMEAFQKPHN